MRYLVFTESPAEWISTTMRRMTEREVGELRAWARQAGARFDVADNGTERIVHGDTVHTIIRAD